MYFETNHAYGNIHVEIPKVRRSTRMHCIYQNFDNIYYIYFKKISNYVKCFYIQSTF